jgi:MtN3 and saliva related transmembrane protein
MELVDFLGFMAAFLTTAAFLPQVLQIWKLKSTKDLSLPTLLTFIAGISIWLVYGLLLHNAPIIIANTITLILNLVILFFKLKYG